MRFEPKDQDMEVSLEHGLSLLESYENSKLYSDGLEEDEFIFFHPKKGFCYEDGCVIGTTLHATLQRLISAKWLLSHKFYFVMKGLDK